MTRGQLARPVPHVAQFVSRADRITSVGCTNCKVLLLKSPPNQAVVETGLLRLS